MARSAGQASLGLSVGRPRGMSRGMKVFISHAHEDEALVRRIAEGLQRSGLDVWLDELNVMPGDNFAERISRALDESQAMVVVITANALRSPWVRREIEYALGRESYSGRVVPVIAAPQSEVPEEKIPWILRRFQFVVLHDPGQEDEGIRQIAAALRKAS